jgi:hypothetical protein
MTDTFSDYAANLESPASHAFDITPNDAVDLAVVTRALNVGTDGSVRVTTRSGETVTLFMGAGGAFSVRVNRVWATGTTATGIVGLY